jgi:copper chaperone CopZ
MKKMLIGGLTVLMSGILVVGFANFATGGVQHPHDSHDDCGTCHTDSTGSTITKENPQLNAHGLALQAAADSNENTAENTDVRIYEVFGMNCPGCHGGLNKLVQKISAVQQSEANWEKKRLMVTVKPGAKLNDEDVYDAIRRANFTPGERLK